MRYRDLITSMGAIVRQHRALREATINGFLCYAALTAFWTTLVFLIESPTYRLGSAVAGMFGLVAAGGAMLAPFVGRLADRKSPRLLVGAATTLMALSYVWLAVLGQNLWGLIFGVIALDLAAQSATISNQATVYSLPREIHSRAYTVYRGMYSVGGSIGALAGSWGWTIAGWHGVCLTALSFLTLALGFHAFARHSSLVRSREENSLPLFGPQTVDQLESSTA